ncbi:MAG: hypothetical protein V9G04_03530 [Nocardioides sp.]
MRVYIATTLPELAVWHAQGLVPADGVRFVAPDESEEGEYAALEAAAEASSELLGGLGRRVVVVAETADEDAEVPWSRVEAVHAGAVDDDHREDLGWYATQEIADLVK